MDKKKVYLDKLANLDEKILERLAKVADNKEAVKWFELPHKWLAVKAFLKIK